MNRATRERFARLWHAKVPLADIADRLGYSFQSLAKWRMILNLPKRYGGGDDGEIPTPPVIRLRCLQQQTNWTETERRLRWRGPPHTIYESITTSDFQP
jgi:hypothetical protein